MAKIRKLCADCGSADIRADANAAWSIDAQAWELDTVTADIYCIDCDAMTESKDEEIAP